MTKRKRPPVEIKLNKTKVKRFEMIEGEVTFDDDYFHLSAIGWRNYHNAYDADENGTLFRADAVFTHKDCKYVVPVFAAQREKNGPWKWFVRFQPDREGSWRVRVRVLSWHPKEVKGKDRKEAKREYVERGKTKYYYEHSFGLEFDTDGKAQLKEADYRSCRQAEKTFTVVLGDRPGPLSVPIAGSKENPHYFYRQMPDGKTDKRRPFFLYGVARAWVSKQPKWTITPGRGSSPPPQPKKGSKSAKQKPADWDQFIDRDTELFEPMCAAGCNVLYHWMAPWETQFVHQSREEFWPKKDSSGRFTGQFKAPFYPARPLSPLFRLPITDKQHLQTGQGSRVSEGLIKSFGKNEFSLGKKATISQKGKLWIIQDGNETYHIKEGDHTKESGKKLHVYRPDTEELAYKRYDQGRALHMDDILNLADDYDILIVLVVMTHHSLQDACHWWDECGWPGEPKEPPAKAERGCRNKRGFPVCSYPQQKGEYLDNVKKDGKIIHAKNVIDAAGSNGFQLFEGPGKKPIKITHFFMMHDGPESEAWQRRLWKHYANFWRYIIGRWAAHRALGAWVVVDELEGVANWDRWWADNKTVSDSWHDNVLRLLRGELKWQWRGRELPYTGDYLNHPITSSTTYEGNWWSGGKEKVDFVSHHAYPEICWKPDSRKVTGGERVCRATNSSTPPFFPADRRLWSALCKCLERWSEANQKALRVVTEYGCFERKKPSEKWDVHGKRVPSYTHFANWAALMLGHAGIPFKWNDGKEFGEMASRGALSVAWSKKNYPVDNYAEVRSIVNFLKGVDIEPLYPTIFSRRKLYIPNFWGGASPDYKVWGLADRDGESILVWIYDKRFYKIRRFSTEGRRVNGQLVITQVRPNKTYTYQWYDTWDGKFIPGKGTGQIKSDRRGTLRIPLHPFPLSRKRTVRGVADGNDIAIRLTIARKHRSRHRP